jgi:acyl dehydratase
VLGYVHLAWTRNARAAALKRFTGFSRFTGFTGFTGFRGFTGFTGFTGFSVREVHVAIREGWTGRVYEDFEVGDIYPHPLGRTVLAADNIWFTLLTQNTNPIHFDSAYAEKTEFGKPLVDSTFTLALVTGQSVTDISQNAMANLGWDEVRLPNPVFEGDTIYSRSEVLEKRESKSRPNVGIVTFKTTGFNQDGVIVIEYRRTVMIYKRGHVPETARVRPPAPKRT